MLAPIERVRLPTIDRRWQTHRRRLRLGGRGRIAREIDDAQQAALKALAVAGLMRAELGREHLHKEAGAGGQAPVVQFEA